MKRRTRSVTAVVTSALSALLLVAAGCGDDATFSADRLPTLVLQVDDLPSGFSAFDSGAQTLADAIPGPRQDAARYGREGGWKSRFRRRGGLEARGPLVVESRADVFGGSGGAKRDLDAYRDQYALQAQESGGAGAILAAPELGDGAVAMKLRQPGNPGVQLYAIAWRRENVTASVTVTGILRRLAFAESLRIAQAQARRIDAER